MKRRRFIVAVTGASGTIYGLRLLEALADEGFEIHMTVSDGARKVAAHELHLNLDLTNRESVLAGLLGRSASNVVYHHHRNLAAPIASGSFQTEGMVVVPCSMGTLGRIASGVSTTLVDRAADVCLKERRKLLLVPRETPYSEIHLENMLRVTRAGAVVLPASPGFYSRQANVEDLVDFVVARILDHLGVEHRRVRRYGEGALPAQGMDPEEDAFQTWE